MTAYIVPQVTVHQEFGAPAQTDARPRPACIVGPHAKLIRFNEAAERSLGLLDDYQHSSDTAYSWPNKPATAAIDDTYTKVFIKDALLQYFTDPVSGGSTATVSGFPNRVRIANKAVKANGTAYPRHADFRTRDVQVGDIVRVRSTVSSTTYDLLSHVTGFVAETVAASIASATTDTNNQATVGASVVGAFASGGTNCVSIDSMSGASYDGLAEGDVQEVYTIKVTQASVGNDATTARLLVTSASGHDDVADVIPAAFSSATTIGTRGLTVTWKNTHATGCAASATAAGIPERDFVVGQTWLVTVRQAFTKPVPTSAGTYAGASDLTYCVEVSEGGTWVNLPKIIVTATTGEDMSGPTTVTAAGSAVAIGTKGATIAFTGNGLRKGDKYYVACTAASAGAYKTLILAHNFDSVVIAAGNVASELTLYMKRDIEVPRNRIGHAPEVNWVQTADSLTIKAGIKGTDPTWVNGTTLVEMPAIFLAGSEYSQVYANVRYWLSDLCRNVQQIREIGELSTISGELHPDNPLKWGVSKAIQNANGVNVSFLAVCDPEDTDEWTNAMAVLDGDDRAYGIVPLTKLAAAWSVCQAHVVSQSNHTKNSWRTLWLNTKEFTKLGLVTADTSTDGAAVLAVLEASGGANVQIRVPAGNANFQTNGVVAGDTVRFRYTTDGFGGFTYTEYTVATVTNENTLILTAAAGSLVATPSRCEVWRTLNSEEKSKEYAKTHGYASHRTQMVWPPTVVQDGYTVAGYYHCCCLAGLASGVVPHRSLTNLAVNGTSSLIGYANFTQSQLDTMAAGGVWIAAQDNVTGAIYSRHGITTDVSGVLTKQEECMVRNFDSISRHILNTYKPYIGQANNTEDLVQLLRAETMGSFRFLESSYHTALLGSQLVAGEIVSIYRKTTDASQVVIRLKLSLPAPLNVAEVWLEVPV